MTISPGVEAIRALPIPDVAQYRPAAMAAIREHHDALLHAVMVEQLFTVLCDVYQAGADAEARHWYWTNKPELAALVDRPHDFVGELLGEFPGGVVPGGIIGQVPGRRKLRAIAEGLMDVAVSRADRGEVLALAFLAGWNHWPEQDRIQRP